LLNDDDIRIVLDQHA